MGYWILVQVRTMMRSARCKINLRMRENILRRVLMIPRTVFLRALLRIFRSIDLIGSGGGRVDGLGDAL